MLCIREFVAEQETARLRKSTKAVIIHLGTFSTPESYEKSIWHVKEFSITTIPLILAVEPKGKRKVKMLLMCAKSAFEPIAKKKQYYADNVGVCEIKKKQYSRWGCWRLWNQHLKPAKSFVTAASITDQLGPAQPAIACNDICVFRHPPFLEPWLSQLSWVSSSSHMPHPSEDSKVQKFLLISFYIQVMPTCQAASRPHVRVVPVQLRGGETGAHHHQL